jgi:hypothetical protein
MALTFDTDAMTARLAAMLPQLQRAAVKAEEAFIDARVVDAQVVVPVQTGELHDSIHREGSELIADAPHSVWIHEGLELNHPSGGEAKYVERPLLDHADDLLAQFARQMEALR